MTVKELLERIDSHELTEWMAFSNLEPFGSKREDWRAGMIAAQVVNVQLRKGQRLRKPDDFFPEVKPPAPEQTAEEQKRLLLSMLGPNVKRIKRKKDGKHRNPNRKTRR